MKKIIAMFFAATLAISAVSADNLKYVDPMIGTDGIGHTFPAATVPFSMVQVGPTNTFKGWNWCSGYHYSDPDIKGFAHDFISGAGLSAGGDILLMPTTLENPMKAIADDTYRSVFKHENEHASVGYYSVYLDDYQISVELTANERMAVHRYTFNKAGKASIVIDPRHTLAEIQESSTLKFVDNQTMLASKTTTRGAAGRRTVFGYIHFSKPFDTYAEGEYGYVGFDQMKKGEQLEIKVCLSFVDAAGAEKNLKAQDPSLDFDKVYAYARRQWKDILDRFEVKSKDESFLKSFYTSVYHCFISPNIISDVDGRYVVEGKEYKSDILQYSNYSTWDTFRALHPLFTLVEQEKNAEFINSLSSRWFECGEYLPIWECLGFDNFCMIGNSAIPVISEAIVKGNVGIDVEKAYEAMYRSANELERPSGAYGPSGMADYLIYGYVPADIQCSVTKTTEYNYYDWCLAEAAEYLGKNEESLYFRNRSMGHMKLYDPETGYLLPRERGGSLVGKENLTDWNWLQANYVSGNLWGYSTYAPHNVQGLVALHGGPAAFEAWMDRVFTEELKAEGTQHVDISGFIGSYAHGDEPAHHMAYLYSLVGAPEKTRHYIREIMKKFYFDRPDGLVNNDDLGQMSAWYILSSWGFYPVDPCSKKYVLGLPAAEKFSFKLANGKTFTVRAENFDAKKSDVKAIYLNDEKIEGPYITHEQIMDGGELKFVFE